MPNNILKALQSPQQKRWAMASKAKKLKDLSGFPRMSVWNYGPCEHHDKPNPSCEYRACGGEPFKHQKITALYSLLARKSMIANSVGTGKTNSALMTLALEKDRGNKIKALIIVPSTSVGQWVSEIKRWTPGFHVTSVPPKTPKKDRLQTYVSDWELLVMGYHAFQRDAKHLEEVAPLQVVADDVDPILNIANATHLALKPIASQADMVIEMNASSLQASALSSKVLTPDGWVPMRDITKGSKVVTPCGDVAEVLGESAVSTVPVYKVSTSEGVSTRVSGDHLWEVSYASTDVSSGKAVRIMNTVVQTTEKLIERGLHVKKGPANRKGGPTRLKFTLPTVDLKTPDIPLPVGPYTLGTLLGDGSFGGRTPRFHTVDEEMLSYILEEDPDLVITEGRATSNSSAYRMFYLTNPTRNGEPNYISEYARNVGLAGAATHEKFIPEEYMHAGHSQRLALLCGLMDTDGSASLRNGSVFYSSSKVLAHQVADLVRSLGGWAKVVNKGKTPSQFNRNHDMWMTSISMGLHCPFRLERKASRWTPTVRRRRKVASIEPDGEEEVKCIMIDHPSHLYVTDNYIPTHNTRLDQLYAASSLIGGDEVFNSKTWFDRTFLNRTLVTVNIKQKTKNGKKVGSSTRRVWQTQGYKKIKLFKKLFSPMSIRFTYEDISDDVTIPDLISEQVYFDMTKKQRDKYAELQTGVRTILDSKDMPAKTKATSALAAFTIGSQICAGTFALKNSEGGYESDSPDASPKLDWIMNKLTSDWISEKVVVYAKYRGSISALQDRLEENGIEYATIWGGNADPEYRKEEMRRFWEDPDCKVMIISVSGERSLNLQNASILVMWDLQLNPARTTQIAGRVRRAGSKNKTVYVFQLLHNDSQEERYMAALAGRQALFDTVYDVEYTGDDDNLLIERLDSDTILKLIRPD